MAKDRLTKVANINATAREIDFVSRFAEQWQALMDILGISHMVEKQPGTQVKVKRATVVLQNSPNEGDEIPYSQATITELPLGNITIEKYAKGTSLEAIAEFGYDTAVGKTDDALLNECRKKVLNKFYSFLATGEMTSVQTSWQMALAMAQGLCLNEFEKMGITVSGVVGFANILDAYKYLGGASVTMQTQFGITYIKDFMGYNTLFLLPADQVERDRVYATPIDNLVPYFVNPANSDFARAGLEFTSDESNLIGFHSEGNYSHAVSECYALIGLVLAAEYINGVASVKVEASGSLGSVTVASAAGAAAGDSKVTITYTKGVGEKLYYKSAAAAATPTYLDEVDLSSWTEIEPVAGGNNIEDLTSGHKITVIAVNGGGQAVASGNATIVVKS